MTNEINKTIVSYLKENGIVAVDNEAIGNEEYPYAVVTTSRLSVNDNISSWSLEVNVWDKNDFYSRVETIADEVERLLDFARLKSGNNLLCIFKDQKSNIDDIDLAIKRVKIQFDLSIYESEM